MKYLSAIILIIFTVACSSSDGNYHFEQGFFETNEDFGNRVCNNVRPLVYNVSVRPSMYNNIGPTYRALAGVAESRINTIQSLYFEFDTKPILIKGETDCAIRYTAELINVRTQEVIHAELLTTTPVKYFSFGTHNHFIISKFDRELPVKDRIQIVIKCNFRAIYYSEGTFSGEMFFGQYPISIKL